jgi:predicted MPP superfamily phosphohydrolase
MFNFRLFTKVLISTLLVMLLVFAAWAYYDTQCIEIRHYEIRSRSTSHPAPARGLAEALDGIKVAHLSDLHIQSIGLREEKVVEILRREKPDLIFITGDLASFEGPYEPVTSFLQQLEAPLGIYAVLGNTEYSNENGSCVLCHEEKSKSPTKRRHPVFLRNASLPLTINGRTLTLIGVDNPVNKKDNLERGFAGPNDRPAILLAHSPVIFKEASWQGIDLLLCGHNHGGQFFITNFLRRTLPLIDPGLEYLQGFFQEEGTLMYVSRGVGTSFLPFRLGVKPEITFFQFADRTGNAGALDESAILNNPPATVFAGMSLASLWETLNPFNYLHPFSRNADRNPSNILFDFESEPDLRRLNWECHKWFELSEEHATSGRFSLKVTLPPGQYPGIHFHEMKDLNFAPK